jgi:hypothetical protein
LISDEEYPRLGKKIREEFNFSVTIKINSLLDLQVASAAVGLKV